MKTYPYNRTSNEGRRLFQLLHAQYNNATLEPTRQGKLFQQYQVPSVMQCRTNKVSLLIPSNLTGIKRPQICVEADVESSWGEFTENVTTLDFTHDGQELPMTYVQPIEDDAMKLLIDAGLYRDEQFEKLISKLMQDEVFDAQADMNVTYLNIGQPDDELTDGRENVPVLLVDPVHVVHEDHDPSEHTTIQTLLKRSAHIAIELRKEGVRTEQLVDVAEVEQDHEVFISDNFKDVVQDVEEKAVVEEAEKDVDNKFVESSELLDREIDVTEEMKNTIGFNETSEDDRIRDLKEREYREQMAQTEESKPKPTYAPEPEEPEDEDDLEL